MKIPRKRKRKDLRTKDEFRSQLCMKKVLAPHKLVQRQHLSSNEQNKIWFIKCLFFSKIEIKYY